MLFYRQSQGLSAHALVLTQPIEALIELSPVLSMQFTEMYKQHFLAMWLRSASPIRGWHTCHQLPVIKQRYCRCCLRCPCFGNRQNFVNCARLRVVRNVPRSPVGLLHCAFISILPSPHLWWRFKLRVRTVWVGAYVTASHPRRCLDLMLFIISKIHCLQFVFITPIRWYWMFAGV